MALVFREIRVKSILNPSQIEGIDYAINPYLGCLHGCLYCYADFMRKFSGHKEPWGDFVDIKINSPDLLIKEIKRKNPGEVSLSTVTDPYQPVERRYLLTRRLLEILAGSPFSVSLLTKSSLILRDIEVFRKIKNITIGFSIPIVSDKISSLLEKRTSSPSERFKALKILSEEGFSTWVFVAPTLPYFSDSPENLEQLLFQSKVSGAHHVLFDTFQAYPRVWGKIKGFLSREFPRLVPLYEEYRQFKEEFKEELKFKAQELGKKVGIEVQLAF